ncbi:MAG: isocitrate/isopropylmalate family dehydrogenase, partial [Dehalococcoidia bacterium]|nr:isocitrate/isopropylmalate family dehydrogenase [Dehalococcoidia bacterium]
SGIGVFEPTHGSAPKYADYPTSIVNPIAMVESACMMLDFIDEQDISPSSLAVSWSLKIESEINVTDLALAFHRAKESEAKLLFQANLIDGREMIEIINAGIKPYTKGGQHYMLKLSS